MYIYIYIYIEVYTDYDILFPREASGPNPERQSVKSASVCSDFQRLGSVR